MTDGLTRHSTRSHVAIQEGDFDLGHETAALRAGLRGIGAVASFVGIVREWTEAAGTTDAGLVIEHYPGMTEHCIQRMANEATRRFDLLGVRVIHRVGRLFLGDQIVLVTVAASHRLAAFQGCEFLMDWLKTQAPFWKKEVSAQGSQWVQAREQDDAALARWHALSVAVHQPPVADMNRTTLSGLS